MSCTEKRCIWTNFVYRRPGDTPARFTWQHSSPFLSYSHSSSPHWLFYIFPPKKTSLVKSFNFLIFSLSIRATYFNSVMSQTYLEVHTFNAAINFKRRKSITGWNFSYKLMFANSRRTNVKRSIKVLNAIAEKTVFHINCF